MFGFKNLHAGPQYIIILDISSGSVGVAIADVDSARDMPLLLYAYRAEMRISHEQKKVDHLHAIREVLLEATLDLSSAGVRALAMHDTHGRIQNVAIVCGSPWSKTVTRFISVTDKKPFFVTRAHIDHVVRAAEEHHDMPKAEAKMYTELGLQIAHQEIINIMVNGYTIHTLVGQQGTELTLAHLIELLPKVIKDAVSEAEKNLIPHVPILEHTASFVFHSVIRSMYPHTESYMLATITQEATEITLSEQGILYDTSFAECGLHTLFRGISKKLNTLPEEARGLLRDFAEGKSGEDVTEAIALISDEFAETLESTFKKLRETYVLPRHLFVIADPELIGYFTSLFARIRGVGATAYTNVIGITAEKVGESVAYHKDCPHDIPLSLATIFFHMQAHKKTP